MKGKPKKTNIPDNVFNDPNKQRPANPDEPNTTGQNIPQNGLSNDDTQVMNVNQNQVSTEGNKNRDHVMGDKDHHNNQMNRPRSNPSDNQGR